MSTSPISSSPASLIPALIAAQLVGGGGSTGDLAAAGSDSAAISDQAIAMLEAEQSAMAASIGTLSS